MRGCEPALLLNTGFAKRPSAQAQRDCSPLPQRKGRNTDLTANLPSWTAGCSPQCRYVWWRPGQQERPVQVFLFLCTALVCATLFAHQTGTLTR